MIRRRHFLRIVGLLAVTAPTLLQGASDPISVVPAQGPRTLILAGQRDAFRAYCLTGDGARAFAKIRADLDRRYLNAPLPAEPVTYGDPSPSKRTSDLADLWRAQHDVAGQFSGIAEAAALCWVVTGE